MNVLLLYLHTKCSTNVCGGPPVHPPFVWWSKRGHHGRQAGGRAWRQSEGVHLKVAIGVLSLPALRHERLAHHRLLVEALLDLFQRRECQRAGPCEMVGGGRSTERRDEAQGAMGGCMFRSANCAHELPMAQLPDEPQGAAVEAPSPPCAQLRPNKPWLCPIYTRR